jgi:hypothetical protein
VFVFSSFYYQETTTLNGIQNYSSSAVGYDGEPKQLGMSGGDGKRTKPMSGGDGKRTKPKSHSHISWEYHKLPQCPMPFPTPQVLKNCC